MNSFFYGARFAEALALAGFALLGSVRAPAQNTSDLYRITGGVTQSRSDFYQISVPRGGEYELANLQGPGKITYENGTPATIDADDYISVAFWYQEGAHPVNPLPAFKTRISPSFLTRP